MVLFYSAKRWRLTKNCAESEKDRCCYPKYENYDVSSKGIEKLSSLLLINENCNVSFIHNVVLCVSYTTTEINQKYPSLYKF